MLKQVAGSSQALILDHWPEAWRPRVMKLKPRSRVNRKTGKTILRLPDLEFAKAAVLNSLNSREAQRGIGTQSTSLTAFN